MLDEDIRSLIYRLTENSGSLIKTPANKPQALNKLVLAELKKTKPAFKSVKVDKLDVHRPIPKWDYTLVLKYTFVTANDGDIGCFISVNVKEGEEASGSVSYDSGVGPAVKTKSAKDATTLVTTLAKDIASHMSNVQTKKRK